MVTERGKDYVHPGAKCEPGSTSTRINDIVKLTLSVFAADHIYYLHKRLRVYSYWTMNSVLHSLQIEPINDDLYNENETVSKKTK